MTELDISDMQFNYSEIGDMIKASKGLYTWDFKLEGNRHKIELTHSRIKGKRVITCDGEEINTCLKYTYNYTYSFPLDGHYYTVIQISPDQYDLRIDNESFLILKNKSKRKIEKKSDYKKNRIIMIKIKRMIMMINIKNQKRKKKAIMMITFLKMLEILISEEIIIILIMTKETMMLEI